MQYEQDYLLKKIQCLLTNFDGEVKTLRHEKSQYDVALKNAELRYVENFLRQRLYGIIFLYLIIFFVHF